MRTGESAQPITVVRGAPQRLVAGPAVVVVDPDARDQRGNPVEALVTVVPGWAPGVLVALTEEQERAWNRKALIGYPAHLR